jgi:nucleolar GTP-binding protein
MLRISAAFAPRIGKRSFVDASRRRILPLALASSNDDTTSAPQVISQQQLKRKSTSRTGGLRRLPMLRAPSELLSSARKALYRIKPDSDIKNVRLRSRKHGAETVNALIQALCIPIRDTVDGYRREWRRLHPFERVVGDLTVSARQNTDGLSLEAVLSDLHEARKMILEAGKDWISKIKNAETAKDADEFKNQATDALLQLFEAHASPCVTSLLELQRSLRSAPVVQVDTPALVLVGSPNVGKSSMVRAISSASPEVNNYPFTTRGLTMGHVEVFWHHDTYEVSKAVVPDPRRHPNAPPPAMLLGQDDNERSAYAFSQLCQVMDSPGLLVRPDSERNAMEALTLAAMQHLPTAVCFVMDLSGGAGDRCSSVEDQLTLRKEVRSRFPRRPWVDVVSKVDLGIVDGALERLEEILKSEGNSAAPYILLSIHEGTGVDELRTEIVRMLDEVRVVLDAMAAVEDAQ